MSKLTKLKINGVTYDMAAEKVDDKSIGPDEIARNMDFTLGSENHKKRFTLSDKQIRIIPEGTDTTTVGYLLRHKGEKIDTNDLAAKSVTMEKLGTDVQNMMQEAETNISNAQTAADSARYTAEEALFQGSKANLKLQHTIEPKLEQAQATADEAKDSAETAHTAAGDAWTEARDARSVADQAQETAEYAIGIARNIEGTADQAKSDAEAANRKADNAMSIAKGANQSKTFDTEAEMLSWIESQKANDRDTAIGADIYDPFNDDDKKIYYAVIAVDAEPLKCWYEEDDFWYDSANVMQCTIHYSDETIQQESVYAFEKFGRYYACVQLNRGSKSITSIYANFQVDYCVGDQATNNASFRLITSETEGVSVEFDAEGVIMTDDETLHDLIKFYDLLIGQNFYIRDTGVPDYWWDGSKPCFLETGKVDQTDLENGLQSILDAINTLIGGAA